MLPLRDYRKLLRLIDPGMEQLLSPESIREASSPSAVPPNRFARMSSMSKSDLAHDANDSATARQ
jgi:hypothetical protein